MSIKNKKLDARVFSSVMDTTNLDSHLDEIGGSGGETAPSTFEPAAAAEEALTAAAPTPSKGITALKSDVTAVTDTVTKSAKKFIGEPIANMYAKVSQFFVEGSKYIYVLLGAFVVALLTLLIFRPSFVYDIKVDTDGKETERAFSYWKWFWCSLFTSILSIIVPVGVKIYSMFA
jgi:hypothetical protein